MKLKHLLAVLSLSAASLALAACQTGDNLEADDGGVEAEGSSLPALRAVPESGHPADMDYERGEKTYRLANGKRALFVTKGDIDLDFEEGRLAEGQSLLASSMSLPESQDTFFTKSLSGSIIDYGRSCELRVNDSSVSSPVQEALLQFRVPSSICGTLSNASLVLKTGQMPGAGTGLTVYPFQVTSSWLAGSTGLYDGGCSTCALKSGSPAGFMPPFTGTAGAPVRVDKACSSFKFDITSLVKTACGAGSGSVSVELVGRGGGATVNFHSMEATNAVDRPMLVVTY